MPFVCVYRSNDPRCGPRRSSQQDHTGHTEGTLYTIATQPESLTCIVGFLATSQRARIVSFAMERQRWNFYFLFALFALSTFYLGRVASSYRGIHASPQPLTQTMVELDDLDDSENSRLADSAAILFPYGELNGAANATLDVRESCIQSRRSLTC